MDETRNMLLYGKKSVSRLIAYFCNRLSSFLGRAGQDSFVSPTIFEEAKTLSYLPSSKPVFILISIILKSETVFQNRGVLQICYIFSEHYFIRKPLGYCSCKMHAMKTDEFL